MRRGWVQKLRLSQLPVTLLGFETCMPCPNGPTDVAHQAPRELQRSSHTLEMPGWDSGLWLWRILIPVGCPVGLFTFSPPSLSECQLITIDDDNDVHKQAHSNSIQNLASIGSVPTHCIAAARFVGQQPAVSLDAYHIVYKHKGQGNGRTDAFTPRLETGSSQNSTQIWYDLVKQSRCRTLKTDGMQSMSSAYKPSPLGYGSSTRSSPFRRPQSPASPSTLRQTTPTASPTKQGSSDAGARYTRSPVTSPKQEFRTPRVQSSPEDASETYFPQQRSTPRPVVASSVVGHGSALSQLQPSQARTMREAFQLLDRDSDGTVNREDVADMLNQLGRLLRSQFFEVPC